MTSRESRNVIKKVFKHMTKNDETLYQQRNMLATFDKYIYIGTSLFFNLLINEDIMVSS